jgi:hypothetical protein
MMWGVVEIMGHRTRAGMLSDATIGGATMLRIEHPSLADATGAEPLTEYYSPSAIFCIRPCSKEEAEVAARWWVRTDSSAPLQLSPALDDLVDDDVLDSEYRR